MLTFLEKAVNGWRCPLSETLAYIHTVDSPKSTIRQAPGPLSVFSSVIGQIAPKCFLMTW